MLKPDEFTPYIGKTFRFGPAELVLQAVEVRHPLEAAFSLIFSGSPSPVLPEGSYEASVTDGPSHTLYIMPIHTREATQQKYQVVFN